MPTVSVSRDRLFTLIGKNFTDIEFDHLCFEYGLELDDIEESPAADDASQLEVLYKIEIPANRYDLLCIEGLAQTLRVFLGLDPPHTSYAVTLSGPPSVFIDVAEETLPVRPFVVGAVLRDIHIDQHVYNSLIDLQEKLHQNICRRRTLVAIGTHDLDTLKPPFSYQALPPSDISFVPLRPCDAEYTADQLMHVYKEDAQLKKYLHIIKDKPNYPVIYDAKHDVLSMPPIINGNLSRITTATRNMFIECTATDRTKANVVLNIVIAMFSRYCERKFVVEPVSIAYHDGTVIQTPDLSQPVVTADVDFINRSIGIDIPGQNMVELLARMQLPASCENGVISVRVPIIRSDILHACDIMNDVAVAYGFNEVMERIPDTATIGKQYPLNHLSDLIRREGFAQQGYTEVLTWVTVSNAENFDMMQRVDDGTTAVKIGNPKTLEFQECRTSLLPGLLKTLRENRKAKMPLRLFEVGDVVLKNPSCEVLACNRRKMAAIYCSTAAGFEIIQGLLDHVMQALGIAKRDGNGRTWRLNVENCSDDAFMPKRRASIVYNDNVVGALGWIHPQVLSNFALTYPCSAFEVDLETFL